ncbi:putative phosphatidate phosphatase [Leguminivora glycinivorella]|uniref:putative phosphatidate phosphatase n=1 Tax=Leguminivora glycinivorella TaxID=1035111 RepID=UPI00200EAE1C|nr:putative phosphatidate phosphatase [Leguminivora glycinivorella]
MAKDKKWQLLLDLFSLASVLVPLLTLTQVAHPFERGFFINDDSLKLPFKEQTVTEVTLGIVGFVLNVATILIIEYLQSRRQKNPEQKYIFGFAVPAWVWQSYAAIRTFTFGAGCQQLLSNVTKYAVGRLRPYFMDVCQPEYNETLPANVLGYIQVYNCRNRFDPAYQPYLKDMRLSFFSAHSSFAMYAAVFFIVYIQYKGRWRGSKLLRHAVQFFALLTAWYVGLTRIVENYHHWSDVAVGFINGAIFGFLVVIYVLKPTKHLPLTWQDAPESALPVAR